MTTQNVFSNSKKVGTASFGRVRVVNRHKTGMKGNYFYVGRPTLLGNPFKSRDKLTNIRLYRGWLRRVYRTKPTIRDIVDDMVALVRSGQDIDLACWCAPAPCHADVLRRFILELAKS